MRAREAIIKRVTGALHGYATQVAKGRSETVQVAAAIEGLGAPSTPSFTARLASKARQWWHWFAMSPRNSQVRA
jgi:hypothetical protein